MTKRDLMAVSVKIIGIYYMLEALMRPSELSRLYRITTEGVDARSVSELVVTLALLLPGVILIMVGRFLDSKQEVKQENVQPPIPKNWDKPVFILALRIIAILTLIDILPSFCKMIISFFTYAYEQHERVFEKAIGMTWIELITGIILPVIISLYFLFNPEAFANMILRKSKTQTTQEGV